MEQGQKHFATHTSLRGNQPTPVGSYDTTLKVVGEYDGTTLRLFGALQDAYNYFKYHLFDNKLSPVVLTLNRKARSMGYYRPNSWVSDRQETLPEININPSILHMPATEVMQTLVHEMCHHYQFLFGKAGRGGYHNIEFSRIMFSVGLMCSSTGKPGGRITGESMADYFIEGGRFIQVFNEMPSEFLLPFKPYENTLSLVEPSIEVSVVNQTKDRSKVKYTCQSCGINTWGKPQLNLKCGDCNMKLYSQSMSLNL